MYVSFVDAYYNGMLSSLCFLLCVGLSIGDAAYDYQRLVPNLRAVIQLILLLF